MPRDISVWDWEEAFDEHGFGDGDNITHNDNVGDFLATKFGHKQKYLYGIHNCSIYQLTAKDGTITEFAGDEDATEIRTMLPAEVVKALDIEFDSSYAHGDGAGTDGYEKAVKILEDMSYLNFTADEIWAVEKAKQAIRDCIEMGLNGKGE